MPTPPPSWAAKIWQILANLASLSKAQTEALDKIQKALGIPTKPVATDTTSKSEVTTTTPAEPTPAAPARPSPASIPVCGAKPAEIEQIKNDISLILTRLNDFDDDLSKYRARFLVIFLFNLLFSLAAFVVAVMIFCKLP